MYGVMFESDSCVFRVFVYELSTGPLCVLREYVCVGLSAVCGGATGQEATRVSSIVRLKEFIVLSFYLSSFFLP